MGVLKYDFFGYFKIGFYFYDGGDQFTVFIEGRSIAFLGGSMIEILF